MNTLSQSTIDTLHNIASQTSDSSSAANSDTVTHDSVHKDNAQAELSSSDGSSNISSTAQHSERNIQPQHSDNSSNGNSLHSEQSGVLHNTAIAASALSCPMCSTSSCYVMVRTKCCKQLVCKACARSALIANSTSSVNSSIGTCSLCTHTT
jgi:hypothetical protein